MDTHGRNIADGAESGSMHGLAGWLLKRLRRGPIDQRRLTVLERISLAPRQSLALIEVEGRRLLVGTCQDGAPSFYALDGRRDPSRELGNPAARGSGRISW